MWLSLLGASIQGLWAWRWDGVKTPNASELPFEGRVSVVVCCHDEAARLPEFAIGLRPALDAATQAGYVVEVVAVNHGSSDRTGKVLDALTEEDERWRVVHLVRTMESKKEALAAGIAASQGEVLVLLDADCVPLSSSWLLDMTRGAGPAWDVGVGISLPQGSESMTFLARVQRLEARRLAQRAVGAVDAGQPYLAFGRNMAFTRDMWDRVGGFGSHLDVPSGDDDLWLAWPPKRPAPPKPPRNGPRRGGCGDGKKRGTSPPALPTPCTSKSGCCSQDWDGGSSSPGLSTIPRGHPSGLPGARCWHAHLPSGSSCTGQACHVARHGNS